MFSFVLSFPAVPTTTFFLLEAKKKNFLCHGYADHTLWTLKISKQCEYDINKDKARLQFPSSHKIRPHPKRVFQKALATLMSSISSTLQLFLSYGITKSPNLVTCILRHFYG